MKFPIICLVVLMVLLSFSCRQHVEGFSLPAKEEKTKVVDPLPTPFDYEESDIIEQFSRMGAGNVPEGLKIGEYEIEPVLVKKVYDEDSLPAEVYEAVLTKNGKKIARYEGVRHPLGNFISFGLYSFVSISEKQLFIVEEAHRYDREVIINLYPRYEVLFDAADFEVLRGYLRVVDMENDGEKEITLAKNCNMDFSFPNSDEPWLSIVFKFDVKARKYLPASHIFPEYTLKEQDSRIQNLSRAEKKKFSDLLEIFMAYVYAGKEPEAWKIFESSEFDLPVENYFSGKIENRQTLKKEILKNLRKDKIYQFINKDLKRTNGK